MRKIAVLLCCFLLTGCATKAKEQFDTIHEKSLLAKKMSSDCFDNIYKSKDFAIISEKMPRDFNEPNYTQLSSIDFISSQEKKSIFALNNDYFKCRKIMGDFFKENVYQISILYGAYLELVDREFSDLLKGKINWGNFVTNQKNLYKGYESIRNDEEKKLIAQLQQEDEKERQERAALIGSMFNNYAQHQREQAAIAQRNSENISNQMMMQSFRSSTTKCRPNESHGGGFNCTTN
ncbi:MAG: hypothetical protein ACOYK8_05580 [Alphaproteobacteria bacterium]